MHAERHTSTVPNWRYPPSQKDFEIRGEGRRDGRGRDVDCRQLLLPRPACSLIPSPSDPFLRSPLSATSGCCDGKNAFPNLIQGTPATGDAWRFVLSDGHTVGVCQNTSGGTDCDGKANIL